MNGSQAVNRGYAVISIGTAGGDVFLTAIEVSRMIVGH